MKDVNQIAGQLSGIASLEALCAISAFTYAQTVIRDTSG